VSTTTGILVIEKLRKEFKRVSALKGIDIVLDKPGVYGFLGPNGAGKSTTFRLICALLRPTSGRILVDGIDVQKNTRAAVSKLGVQFDSPGFYPYLTGRENLTVITRWLDGTPDPGRIDQLLKFVGLENAANRKAGGYSWGMRQRLGLAAALISDPKLVCLDEPTNGLDPAGIADVRRLLPSLARDEGRTILVSSHRMDEVEQVCDHVTIIHEGRIVAAGTPGELAAAEDSIEIRCEDPNAAAEFLRKLDGIAEVQVTGVGTLSIQAPDVPASRINELLVGQKMPVEQVMRRRESLEQVFFRLTNTGMSTPQPGGSPGRRAPDNPPQVDGSPGRRAPGGTPDNRSPGGMEPDDRAGRSQPGDDA
jgi:ABC-2 type transport system ATP-binding protein